MSFDITLEDFGASSRIPAGDYPVCSDFTITSPLRVSRGAVFHIGDGVTLTLDGGIEAPPYKLFECVGTGRVVINSARQRVGFPEWWGAVPNSETDCRHAINTCIEAVTNTVLQSADYKTSGPIEITKTGKHLSGSGYGYNGATFISRILLNDSSAPILAIGSPVPAGMISGVRVKNVTLIRSVAPATGSDGVSVVNALFTRLHMVDSWESSRGFFISGTVQTHIDKCYSARTLAGATPAADYFSGYFFDGNSGMSAAGGNASIYLADSIAGCGLPALSASGSVGFHLAGPCADAFLLRPESTGCAQGVHIYGSSGTAKAQSGDADIHITDAVVDAFSQWGIYMTNLSAYAAIDVKGCYFAPAGGSTATSCIGVTNSGGTVMLTNNQGVGWPTPVMGLYVENSSGVQARSNTYLGCAGGSQFIGASDCTFEDVYNNPSQSATYAVYMRDCTRNYARPTVKGGASIFGYGVLMDGAGNSHNEINCTGINPNALVAGSAHKLLINGASISTPGVHSTNLASGVMT